MTPPENLFFNDANLGSFWYGREFTVPPGTSSGLLAPDYGDVSQAIGGLCLRSITITSSIKLDGIEVLAALVCSGKIVWAGEHNARGSLTICREMHDMPMTTPECFMWVQTISSKVAAQVRAYEMQVTGIVTL